MSETTQNGTETKTFQSIETDIIFPPNGNKLSETSKTWIENETGVVIWKTMLGRVISEDELKKLLSGEVLGPFTFTKKDQTTFEARIVFNFEENKITFPSNGNAVESKFNCPFTGEILLENDKAYFCKASEFTLWKKYFEHKLTNDEVKALISFEDTNEITDFVSKAGKAFKGKLRLDKDEKKVKLFFDDAK